MADAKQTPCAGVEISLRIGQHVRHRDHAGKRVTGIITSLQVESEQGLTASVILDEPIILPARGEGDREIRINWQTASVTEFVPFDDRDELIAEMLAVLRKARVGLEIANERIEFGSLLGDIDSTIAKATGSAT